MKRLSQFERLVLAMAMAVLFMMGGVLVYSHRPVDAWRVETQRNDAPGVSVSEEGPPKSLLEGETIDLNTAGQADLERLPGIGATRARDIIRERQENGPFRSVDELERVKGIGPATVEALRPYITVG